MSQGFWPLLTWASEGDYYWHVSCVLHPRIVLDVSCVTTIRHECLGCSAYGFHDDRWCVQIDSTWCWIRVLGHVGSQLLLWPDRARGVFCGACLFDLLRMQLFDGLFTVVGCSCKTSIKSQIKQIYGEFLPGFISAIQIFTDLEKQPLGLMMMMMMINIQQLNMVVNNILNKVMFTGHMKLTPKPRAFWLGGV